MLTAISRVQAGVHRYLERDLWRIDPAASGRARSLAVGVMRVVVVVVRALFDAQLNLEATALVYRTLLSIVPLLAVGFSVLKAFGAEYKIDAVLARMLTPLGASGAEVASQVVGFVDNLRVSVLGAIGFVLLFYTVLSVIERIESAFNGIWHVRRPRSLARKFSDYLSIVLVGPVLVFGAFGIMAAAQNYWLVKRVLSAAHLAEVSVFVARHGAPFVLLVAAFSLLYRLLPHTRVTLRAALVGGITAALMWHLAGYGFALFVAGSTSSYAAIYSGAAVFLITLIWLQLAWLIVLTGAQVAYVYQHPIASVIVRGRPSLLLRERIGLAALVEITRRYLRGEGPSQAEGLAHALDAPLGTLEDLLEDFVASGLLVHTQPDGVLLARAPDHVSVIDVLDAIREPPASYDVDPVVVPDPVADALSRRDEAVRSALCAVTLRSLANASDSDSRLTAIDHTRAA